VWTEEQREQFRKDRRDKERVNKQNGSSSFESFAVTPSETKVSAPRGPPSAAPVAVLVPKPVKQFTTTIEAPSSSGSAWGSGLNLAEKLKLEEKKRNDAAAAAAAAAAAPPVSAVDPICDDGDRPKGQKRNDKRSTRGKRGEKAGDAAAQALEQVTLGDSSPALSQQTQQQAPASPGKETMTPQVDLLGSSSVSTSIESPKSFLKMGKWDDPADQSNVEFGSFGSYDEKHEPTPSWQDFGALGKSSGTHIEPSALFGNQSKPAVEQPVKSSTTAPPGLAAPPGFDSGTGQKPNHHNNRSNTGPQSRNKSQNDGDAHGKGGNASAGSQNQSPRVANPAGVAPAAQGAMYPYMDPSMFQGQYFPQIPPTAAAGAGTTPTTGSIPAQQQQMFQGPPGMAGPPYYPYAHPYFNPQMYYAQYYPGGRGYQSGRGPSFEGPYPGTQGYGDMYGQPGMPGYVDPAYATTGSGKGSKGGNQGNAVAGHQADMAAYSNGYYPPYPQYGQAPQAYPQGYAGYGSVPPTGYGQRGNSAGSYNGYNNGGSGYRGHHGNSGATPNSGAPAGSVPVPPVASTTQYN
jgi:hypothetical protein